jgi:hypothetical protein
MQQWRYMTHETMGTIGETTGKMMLVLESILVLVLVEIQ